MKNTFRNTLGFCDFQRDIGKHHTNLVPRSRSRDQKRLLSCLGDPPTMKPPALVDVLSNLPINPCRRIGSSVEIKAPCPADCTRRLSQLTETDGTELLL
ncbi:hypothetical protein AVEN_179570-1 [Araneus ventricosus]|uniref:Uncharacterized protein n=1 Tax=Araneus ventricosus TaxID=182803 RepID=A0A4Y2BBV3_ARAVE|nr:hypothetical protein AVEN_179570-1 [Araneus ventricosus]